jgi:hypothetical protein
MLIGNYPFYVDDYRRYVEQVLALHPGLTHVRNLSMKMRRSSE